MSHESVADPASGLPAGGRPVTARHGLQRHPRRDPVGCPAARPAGEGARRRGADGHLHDAVKEALRRLEQEGLVVSQPRRGAVVSRLVQIPVEEIEEIRGGLEAIAARLAATRMSDAELARLRTSPTR